MSSDDDKHDITRIEDLSEFLHADDEDDLPEPDEGSDNLTQESTDPSMKIPSDITESGFDTNELDDFGGSDDFGGGDDSFGGDDDFAGDNDLVAAMISVAAKIASLAMT